MHMRNISVLYMQSIRKLQYKLWYKMTSPCKHYLSTNNTCKQEQTAKSTKLSFCQNILLATNFFKCSLCLHYVGKVSGGLSNSSGTSCRIISPICIHYLSTNKTLIKKQSFKNIAKLKMLSFCQKVFLWHQTSSCKCSIIYNTYTRYQDVSLKPVERVKFPVYALSMHY